MECPHKTWKHNACVCIYCILFYGSFKCGSSNQISELKLSVFSSNICKRKLKVCLFSFFFVLLRMNVLYTRDVLDSVFCWVFTLKQSLSLPTLYERAHTHTHTHTLEWANPDKTPASLLFFQAICWKCLDLRVYVGQSVWDQPVWKCVHMCVCVCVCVRAHACTQCIKCTSGGKTYICPSPSVCLFFFMFHFFHN